MCFAGDARNVPGAPGGLDPCALAFDDRFRELAVIAYLKRLIRTLQDAQAKAPHW